MRILLHSGPGLISTLIKAQTRGEFSHCSVWFPETEEVFESREFKGVQKIHKDDILRAIAQDPRIKVNVYRMALPHDDRKAREWMMSQLGKSYDYRSVIRFVTRLKPREDETYFCSEFGFTAVEKSGHPKLLNCNAGMVSPVLMSISPHLIFESSLPEWHAQEPIEGGMGQEAEP